MQVGGAVSDGGFEHFVGETHDGRQGRIVLFDFGALDHETAFDWRDFIGAQTNFGDRICGRRDRNFARRGRFVRRVDGGRFHFGARLKRLRRARRRLPIAVAPTSKREVIRRRAAAVSWHKAVAFSGAVRGRRNFVQSAGIEAQNIAGRQNAQTQHRARKRLTRRALGGVIFDLIARHQSRAMHGARELLVGYHQNKRFLSLVF